MKKRLLSLALCLVLVVGLFSGLTVNASAGKIDDLKKQIAEKLIKEKIEQFKEEFEIPDLDMDAILSSFGAAATSGHFGENSCLHWEVTGSLLTGKTLTISGKGAMPDFNFPEGILAPWWNYEALGMLTSFGSFKLEGELKKVVIKDGVTNVSNYALFFLPAAEQITLPESVTSIGRYGIALCSKLNGFSLPKAVTGIGDFGLAGNNFTSISLPDGLQTLGRGAFDACASLSGMTLPAAITAVPGKCFADCTKLLTVDYKGEVTAIGERAFEGCKSLTKAPIPATVTELGNSAFNGCVALTEVSLPDGVTDIPDACFQGCTALAEMKLPATVTSVGHNSFTGCKALTDVRCYGDAPTVQPGGAAEHSFEPAIVTIHYNPAMNWTLEADGTWQGYKVSSKGACLHTGYGTSEHTVPPTCGADGRIETVCSNCGEIIETKVIPATGEHTWDSGKVTTEPTEKDPGVMTYTCVICGAIRTEVIPATGPHIHDWDDGVVTTEPTETTPGIRTYTCKSCGKTRTELIPATGPVVCPGDATCPSHRFTDVPGPSRWEHKGIDYCVARGLMAGVGAATFSPNTTSTRAQIVQILYKLSGDTTDYSKYYTPFTDVKRGDWFYNAVAWAYDHDIVKGTGEHTFSPEMPIQREQLALILYGYAAKYAPSCLGGAVPIGSFPDAGSVSNWAYAAMSWAVGNGLISGSESNGVSYLMPKSSATRAQVSAIMMRFCQLTGM